MFEQAIKNIDDILWKEAGCTTELDYTVTLTDAAGRNLQRTIMGQISSSMNRGYLWACSWLVLIELLIVQFIHMHLKKKLFWPGTVT